MTSGISRGEQVYCPAGILPYAVPLPRPSQSLHLCQGYFCGGEPEGHVHGTVHLDGGGERGAGQCSTACLAVQRAETVVTVRLQLAHAEFLSQGEGVLVVGFG